TGARRRGPGAAGGGAAIGAAGDDREGEALLAAAHQFEIDLGQQFRIEQRAMLGAPRIVYAEAAAERVEAVLRARKAAAGDVEGVDCTRPGNRGVVDPAELGIDELHVEGSVVDHQPGIADEVEKL